MQLDRWGPIIFDWIRIFIWQVLKFRWSDVESFVDIVFNNACLCLKNFVCKDVEFVWFNDVVLFWENYANAPPCPRTQLNFPIRCHGVAEEWLLVVSWVFRRDVASQRWLLQRTPTMLRLDTSATVRDPIRFGWLKRCQNRNIQGLIKFWGWLQLQGV